MKLVFVRLTCRIRAGAPPIRAPPVGPEVAEEDGHGHSTGASARRRGLLSRPKTDKKLANGLKRGITSVYATENERSIRPKHQEYMPIPKCNEPVQASECRSAACFLPQNIRGKDIPDQLELDALSVHSVHASPSK